jgi:type I restriction enzyme S subunit
MNLKFKYIPLTFLKDENHIKFQIKNTIILKYLFNKYNRYTTLEKVITGTQYGFNASAQETGSNKFLRISDITDGKVDWNSVPFCDCSDESTYLVAKKDLLVARTGGTTGKSFIIEAPPEKAIFAGYLIRIRADKKSARLNATPLSSTIRMTG